LSEASDPQLLAILCPHSHGSRGIFESILASVVVSRTQAEQVKPINLINPKLKSAGEVISALQPLHDTWKGSHVDLSLLKDFKKNRVADSICDN